MITARLQDATLTVEFGSHPTNELSPKDILELADHLRWASYEPEIGAVILTGSGEDFCGGRILGPDSQPVALARELEATVTLASRIDQMPQLVVAAVEGRAWGIGLSLTVLADISIAAADAEFALPEMRHGRPPLPIMSYLVRYVPYKTALDWALTARAVGVDELARLGVLTQVCAPGTARAVAVSHAAAAIRAGVPTLHRLKSFTRAAADLIDRRSTDAAVRSLVGHLTSGGCRPALDHGSAGHVT